MSGILNLDDQAYQELVQRAALEGRDVGQLLNEAMKTYLALPRNLPRESTLRNLKPEPFPEGNERLSEEIDLIVYGIRRS